MALQSSGQIKMSEIGTELECTLSNLSLNSMSNTAGKSSPHGMAEFYGYTSATVVTGADVLIVAGGGGGGCINGNSGGGGAGGFLSYNNRTVCSGMVITVGGGGTINNNGSNSSISSTGTAIGGGRGSGLYYPATGGSGGGGMGLAGSANVCRYTACPGISGQGNAGANGIRCNNGAQELGGGGGGAGSAGCTPLQYVPGYGGSGRSWCNGSTYAQGGQGGCRASQVQFRICGCIGSPNTGDGGGGSSNYQSDTCPGGAGGSGIVIIRYPSATNCFNGGTVTCSGGYVYHTFTSSGTLTKI